MLCGRHSALRRCDSVHSFVSSFERRESLVARSHRVIVTLHENLLCTPPACRTARNPQNSLAPDTGVRKEFREFV